MMMMIMTVVHNWCCQLLLQKGMKLWMAAGVDGNLKQGTEKVVQKHTEVLKNVVVFIDITVKEEDSVNILY